MKQFNIQLKEIITRYPQLEDLFKKGYIGILILWTMPWPKMTVNAGLDSSWIIGIYMAFLKGFVFGRDIIFTYGIMGFLVQPQVLNYNLWRISLFFSIFIHVVFFILLYLLLKRISAKWYHYLLLLPVMIFSNPCQSLYPLNDLIIPLIISFGLFVTVINTKEDWTNYAIALVMGLLLAIATLLKLNIAMIGIAILPISAFMFWVFKKNFRPLFMMVIVYIVTLTLMLLITGQYEFFYDYLRYSFEISKGYNEAMTHQGAAWQTYLGVISVICMGAFLICSIMDRNKELFAFLMLNLPALILEYKHGFVRHDLHIVIFLQLYILIFGVIYILFDIKDNKKPNILKELRFYANVVITTVLIVTAFNIAPVIITHGDITSRYPAYVEAFNMLLDESVFNSMVDAQKDNVRDSYNIDQTTLKTIGNDSVDILPWDISLCWAYDLNWSPRLALQSYSDYTHTLDEKTSSHFSRDSSPSYILYTYKSIDGRYPAFDEPYTLRAILYNYSYLNYDGKYILLNNSREDSKNFSEVNLGDQKAHFAEEIDIPENNDSFIFAYININYSPYGNIVKLIYKPSPVYISFKLENGSYTKRYKIIPDTVKDGVLLSKYIENNEDFQELLLNQDVGDISSFIIETDNTMEYSETIDVRFVKAPALKSNISIIKNFKNANGDSNSTIVLSKPTINGESRLAIPEHPLPTEPVRIESKEILVKNDSIMKISIGINPLVWAPEKGDGVQFVATIKSNETVETVLSEYIDPKNNVSDRRWKDYIINLSQYKNSKIILILETSSGPKNDSSYDWAYWSVPVIYDKSSA